MIGSEVGPLTQISFAKNYYSGVAQLLRDKGVLQWFRTYQRERACCGHHAIGCVYIVFDENGDPVKRAACSFILTLAIEGRSYSFCLRIYLDYRINGRPFLIDFTNAIYVFFEQGS